MGYDVMVSGEVTIEKDKVKDAVLAVVQKLMEREQDSGDPLEYLTVEYDVDPTNLEDVEAFLQNRLECFCVSNRDGKLLSLGNPDGDMDYVRREEEERWLFEAIAPYAEGTIYFEGEDHYQWRWEIQDGKIVEEGTEVVWGKDTKAPEAVQKIVKVIYPERMKGLSLTTDPAPEYDTLDDSFKSYETLETALQKIEEILRGHGFGPQAGKNELERLADV